MKTPIVGRGLLAVVFLVAWGLATGANAGVFRAFLSSTGNDGNPCSLTAPCRLLPAALAAVVDGGRVTMLDSANYNTGTVTITKSVTIDANPGGSAGVAAINGDAIYINTAGVKVTLRNLIILNYGGGTNGIEFAQGAQLNVENCEISNMSGSGVKVVGTGTATIANSIMRNNASAGVWAQDGAEVVVSASHLLGNGFGVVVVSMGSATTKATVSDTTLSGNGGALIVEGDVAGSDPQVFATRCTITGNTYGVQSLTFSSASSLATVSANMITNNIFGLAASGTLAKIKSLGNNHIADNAVDGAPTSTIALK